MDPPTLLILATNCVVYTGQTRRLYGLGINKNLIRNVYKAHYEFSKFLWLLHDLDWIHIYPMNVIRKYYFNGKYHWKVRIFKHIIVNHPWLNNFGFWRLSPHPADKISIQKILNEQKWIKNSLPTFIDGLYIQREDVVIYILKSLRKQLNASFNELKSDYKFKNKPNLNVGDGWYLLELEHGSHGIDFSYIRSKDFITRSFKYSFDFMQFIKYSKAHLICIYNLISIKVPDVSFMGDVVEYNEEQSMNSIYENWGKLPLVRFTGLRPIEVINLLK